MYQFALSLLLDVEPTVCQQSIFSKMLRIWWIVRYYMVDRWYCFKAGNDTGWPYRDVPLVVTLLPSLVTTVTDRFLIVLHSASVTAADDIYMVKTRKERIRGRDCNRRHLHCKNEKRTDWRPCLQPMKSKTTRKERTTGHDCNRRHCKNEKRKAKRARLPQERKAGGSKMIATLVEVKV